MAVEAVGHWTLPDSAYAMWVRGELDEYLRIPDDGTRVEVVGGEFVVSPSAGFTHAVILSAVQRGIEHARFKDPTCPWRAVQAINLDLVEIGDGYIPDLAVVDSEVEERGVKANALYLQPHDISLVVEVTSSSNAHNDRRPVLGKRVRPTKWSGYARTGVPYYLLVDRDPRRADVTFFGEPDRSEGSYRVLGEWRFGDVVHLPEPFGFKIETKMWKPW